MTVDLKEFTPVQVVVASKAFTYKLSPTVSDSPLQPRDFVVVDFGSKGLTVGVVKSVGQVPVDPNAKFKYKWIVAKVDRTQYDAILEAEAAAAPTADPMARFRTQEVRVEAACQEADNERALRGQ